VAFSYPEADIAELLADFTGQQVPEAAELEALPEVLKGASYFIDVGANVGTYIFHAAKCMSHAKLVAIEANPLLIPVLTKTIEQLRSHGSENEYALRAAAVSDIGGELDFHISRYPTLSSMFPNGKVETVKVPTVALDEFYRPGVSTVVKIDVEGAEYRVLRSAAQFLKSHDVTFFLELHSWGDRTIGKYPLQVCWLFLRYGYTQRKIGTHYLFYRSGFVKRTLAFLREFPSLSAKYFVCRYARGLRPMINRMRRRISRV